MPWKENDPSHQGVSESIPHMLSNTVFFVVKELCWLICRTFIETIFYHVKYSCMSNNEMEFWVPKSR